MSKSTINERDERAPGEVSEVKDRESAKLGGAEASQSESAIRCERSMPKENWIDSDWVTVVLIIITLAVIVIGASH